MTIGAGSDGDNVEHLQHKLERISKAGSGAGESRACVLDSRETLDGVLASKPGGLFQRAWLLSSSLVNRVRPCDIVLCVLDVEMSSTKVGN